MLRQKLRQPFFASRLRFMGIGQRTPRFTSRKRALTGRMKADLPQNLYGGQLCRKLWSAVSVMCKRLILIMDILP